MVHIVIIRHHRHFEIRVGREVETARREGGISHEDVVGGHIGGGIETQLDTLGLVRNPQFGGSNFTHARRQLDAHTQDAALFEFTTVCSRPFGREGDVLITVHAAQYCDILEVRRGCVAILGLAENIGVHRIVDGLVGAGIENVVRIGRDRRATEGARLAAERNKVEYLVVAGVFGINHADGIAVLPREFHAALDIFGVLGQADLCQFVRNAGLNQNFVTGDGPCFGAGCPVVGKGGLCGSAFFGASDRKEKC